MAVIYFDIETTGLNSSTDRVTCIGFLHSDLGVRIYSSHDEKRLLQDASDFLLDCSTDLKHVVSFNGVGFDVPFVEKRINLLFADELVFPLNSGDPVSSLPSLLAPWDFGSKHVDLMLLLSKKWVEVTGSRLATGRLSKNQARDWFDIYEPRAGGALHGVLVAKTQRDWSPIWMHNSLDLFTTKSLFVESRKRGWV